MSFSALPASAALFARAAGILVVLVLATAPSAQVQLVGDINDGSASSSPRYFGELDGKVYFNADDGTNGSELWVYDPADGSTALVKDLNTGAESSNPRNFVTLNGRLYFSATLSDAVPFVYELWDYDPDRWIPGPLRITAAGTGVRPIMALDGMLYFTSYTSSDGERLRAYAPGTGTVTTATGGGWSPLSVTELDGKLYFRGRGTSESGAVVGAELWVYDPSTGSNTLVADINAGAAFSEPQHLTALDGKLYFEADDGTNGPALWVYDPTTDTATLVADVHPDPEDPFIDYLAPLDGKLYFRAYEPTNGTELWVHDPVAGTTTLVADLRPGSPSAFPHYIVVYEGRLFFRATVDEASSELWAYDPNAEGGTGAFALVADIDPGVGQSNPAFLTVLDGRLYFQADDGVRGTEPWVLDLTPVASVTLDGGAGWRMLASPEATTVGAFLDPFWTQGFTGSDVPDGACTAFRFDEGADSFDAGWTCVGAATDDLAPGEGMMVYLFEDDDPTLIGVQNPFPKTLAASSAVSAPFDFEFALDFTDDGRPFAQKGWNLLGAPAGTAVDWAMTGRTAVSPTVYVYDPVYDGGAYRSATVVDGVAYGDLDGGVIPPFQGFFARALAPSAALSAALDAGVAGGDVYGRLAPSDPPLPPPAPRQSLLGATDAEDGTPAVTALGGITPNPTTGRATVAWTLAAAGTARVAVVDLLGREVAVLAEGSFPAGPQRSAVPAGLAPGVYVVRLTAGAVAEAARFTVVR